MDRIYGLNIGHKREGSRMALRFLACMARARNVPRPEKGRHRVLHISTW